MLTDQKRQTIVKSNDWESGTGFFEWVRPVAPLIKQIMYDVFVMILFKNGITYTAVHKKTDSKFD